MPAVEILEPQNTQATHDDRFMRGAVQQLGKVGRSATKRRKETLDLHLRLSHETRMDPHSGRVMGPKQPCTMVNFNPVDVLLEIEGRRLTIPAAGKFQTHQVTCQHAGRQVHGAYMKIENPILYPKTKGHETDGEFAVDVPTHEIEYHSPHAIGCTMFEQYNSPNFKMMGGLLFFDQDIRHITDEILEANEGYIWVPERTKIGDSDVFSYSMRAVKFEEELDSVFERQRAYCDMQIQSAHALWSEEDENARKMLTDTHREWARYAVKMYWMRELPEWVTSRITAAGPITLLVKCGYCGAQQQQPDNLFCGKCNAPYDAYRAFKAGKVVPQMYLEMLEGDELAEVAKELRERRARFSEHMSGEAESESATGAGEVSRPLYGAAKAAADAKAAREAGQKNGEGSDK